MPSATEPTSNHLTKPPLPGLALVHHSKAHLLSLTHLAHAAYLAMLLLPSLVFLHHSRAISKRHLKLAVEELAHALGVLVASRPL